MTHRQFQAQVEGLARSCGWQVYFTWKSIHSPPGFPDLVLVRPPRLVFAELKIPPDKVKPAQQEWLDKLALTPADVFVWEPDEYADIVEELREL